MNTEIKLGFGGSALGRAPTPKIGSFGCQLTMEKRQKHDRSLPIPSPFAGYCFEEKGLTALCFQVCGGKQRRIKPVFLLKLNF